MDEDFVRGQVVVVTGSAARQRVVERLFRKSWPDGGMDRIDVQALRWMGLWRPMRCAIDVRTCGCETGRCEICN
jgi:hypothetical protein